MVEALLDGKVAVTLIWFAALFAAERWWPRRPAGPAAGGKRLLSNLSLFALNAAVSLAIVVPVTLWAASLPPDWRPPQAEGGLWILADVLLLDLWIYGWHRLNHGWQPLWRFHRVHHLDRHLDTTTAVRFHLAEVALSAVARAPVIVLTDMALVSVVVFETLVLLAAVFAHANLRLPAKLERVVSRVLVTPALHAVHHHARRCDTDSNYGTILSVWDRAFGSLSATRAHPGMAIGIEGTSPDAPIADRPLPGLLLYPLAPLGEASATAPASPQTQTPQTQTPHALHPQAMHPHATPPQPQPRPI